MRDWRQRARAAPASQTTQCSRRLFAVNRDFKWLDLRVLLVLLANVKDSSVEISQAEVAQKLGVEASNISRSIKKLKENQIVEPKLIGGKLVGYRFLIDESEQV